MTATQDLSKERGYRALVEARKACRACAGLVNPSACENGRFDCDEIGLWSTWQGNLDAPLLVIGQDWVDVAWFLRESGKTTSTSVTNKSLIKLLQSIGFDIPLACSSTGRGDLFFTNAILCLKQGGAQGRVQSEWVHNCGRLFLRPLIELVRPKVVVALGKKAYGSVLASYDLTAGNFRAAVEAPRPVQLSTGIAAFAVYHCGRRTQNINRGLQYQLRDWQRIAGYLERSARGAVRSTASRWGL